MLALARIATADRPGVLPETDTSRNANYLETCVKRNVVFMLNHVQITKIFM